MRQSRKVIWDMINYFCYFPLALTNISPSRDRLRAVSLFSVIRRAKRETRKWLRAWLIFLQSVEQNARHANGHARDWFFCCPSSKTRDTQMATRVTDFSVVRRAKRETREWPRAWLMARDGRGTPPSFRASRGFAAPARVNCSHQVWRKREAARSLLPWHSFKFLFFEEQLTHNHPQYLSGLSRSCMWTKIGD